MKGKHILLGITGGIAAYKSASLCRLLIKSGATVQVIMSQAATEFITPLTLETLSGRPVQLEMFNRPHHKVAHIELGDHADLLIVAPATADYLARAAGGRASDLISAVTLAYTGPVLAAPAMNTNMWNNPATRRNMEILTGRHGWTMVSPESGDLACGWVGPGRMAEPETIVERARDFFDADLGGRHIIVTAGPTIEDIDPVRFISNRSSGKMGYAIAKAAAQRGAEVTLVFGPNPQPTLPSVRSVPIRSARQMYEAVHDVAPDADAVIMAAAVADYRPQSYSSQKMKKQRGETDRSLTLVQNPDILKSLADRFGDEKRPLRVGFALETDALHRRAQEKLAQKGAHLIVANLAEDGLEGDSNRALILDDGGGAIDTGVISKQALAEKILDKIRDYVIISEVRK